MITTCNNYITIYDNYTYIYIYIITVITIYHYIMSVMITFYACEAEEIGRGGRDLQPARVRGLRRSFFF